MKKFAVIGFTIVMLICVTLFLMLPLLGGKHPLYSGKALSKEAQNLVDAAFSDLPEEWLDYHVHVVGMGTDDLFVNPKMQSLWNPYQYYRYLVYLRASGITDVTKANEQYIARLKALRGQFPKPGKMHLLAFDKFYERNGDVNIDETEFYVSNDYVYTLAQKDPSWFVPVISVHPYRKDALESIKVWHQKGVRFIKWLPNAMGMDPMDESLEPFYRLVKDLDMVILTHVGEEVAVDAAAHQAYGNPLRWRKALSIGTKVIFAHAGSLGTCEDFESRDSSGVSPEVDCFDLTVRLLKEDKYRNNLFADISSITSFNRKEKVIETLLSDEDLQKRLVNGSDYPIPAINAMVFMHQLVGRGFISKENVKYLKEIYYYNPLIFDFVLKRTLVSPQSGKNFDTNIFLHHEAL